MIICEDNLEYFRFIRYLLSSETTTPTVLIQFKPTRESLGTTLPDLKAIGPFSGSGMVEKVLAVVQENIKQKIQDEGSETSSEQAKYCPIKTELLARALPLLSDVYVQLSPTKFVKMFREGTNFSSEDVKKYLHIKGIEYLYLPRENCKKLADLIRVDLERQVQTLDDSGEPTAEDLKLTESVHDAICEIAKEIGFTPEVQEIAKKNVDLVIGQISKHPKLGQTMDYLKQDPKNYISSHSVVLAHTACSLAKAIGWCSEGTFEKLTWAALFHDIALNDPMVAKFQSAEELRQWLNGTRDSVFHNFMEHPKRAVKIINDFEDSPPTQVEEIILQHHELPDGTGFPNKLTSKYISPLASIFIIAHDFVSYHASATEKPSIETFIERHKDQYTGGNFKSILNSLTDHLEQEKDTKAAA